MNIMNRLITLVLIPILIGLSMEWCYPHLLPYGPAVDIDEVTKFSPLDETNDSLMIKHGKTRKIYARDESGDVVSLKGAETVLFDNRGIMHAMTRGAKLVTLTDFEDIDSVVTTAKATVVADLGPNGLPLGGKFAKDGSLYFADPLLGLARVRFFPDEGDKKAVLELVASSVTDGNGKESRIRFADDVDIGPVSGHVYFTDASDIDPIRDIHTGMLDVLYPGVTDAIRGKSTGRLLRYNPITEQVDILATGIWFANGVAVDRDENFIIVSETLRARVLKYHLKGPLKNTLQVMVDGLTGLPDGTDCSFISGKCYAVLPSSKPDCDPIFSVPFSKFIRSFVMMLPKSLLPKPKHYGGVAEIFPGNDQTPEAKVLRVLQDPKGVDVHSLYGVTVHDEKLYFGSLVNDYVVVYDLDE